MSRLRAAIDKAGQGGFRRVPSVLHVEDDEDVLAVMSAGLGDAIAITSARNVKEARFELQRKHFDLVILDLTLPDGSGAELLSAIPSDTVVIIFSASEVDEHLAAQVELAMTKTKTSEIAIAELVRKLTSTKAGELASAPETKG